MGVNSSSGSSQEPVDRQLSPSHPDWIIAHAMATELAIPEVERLWLRFTQLGYGPESSGKLSATEHDVFSDIFVRNILKAMKDDSGDLSFQAFLRTMKWLETSSIDDKLHGIFNILNNGRGLDKDAILRILLEIYPDNKPAEIKKLCDLIMKQLCKSNSKGSVGENEFVEWAHRLTTDQLDSTLSFQILPTQINQDAQSRLSEFRGLTNASSQPPQPPNHAHDTVTSRLTDESLRKVAVVIQRKDWQLVMNALGFLQADLDSFQQTNKTEKILSMLREWRRREGRLATTTSLNTALSDSGISPVL